MPAEWERFKLNKTNSVELTTVRDVGHVPAARRIVEDSRIKAGLVYDESRLNTSRISVAWVSANTHARTTLTEAPCRCGRGRWARSTGRSNSSSRGPPSLQAR